MGDVGNQKSHQFIEHLPSGESDWTWVFSVWGNVLAVGQAFINFLLIFSCVLFLFKQAWIRGRLVEIPDTYEQLQGIWFLWFLIFFLIYKIKIVIAFIELFGGLCERREMLELAQSLGPWRLSGACSFIFPMPSSSQVTSSFWFSLAPPSLNLQPHKMTSFWRYLWFCLKAKISMSGVTFSE